MGTETNLTGSRVDRFTLEETIMSCWQVADDMLLTAEAIIEDTADIDDVHNMLVGMAGVHKMRCQKMWDVFSALIENGDIQ